MNISTILFKSLAASCFKTFCAVILTIVAVILLSQIALIADKALSLQLELNYKILLIPLYSLPSTSFIFLPIASFIASSICLYRWFYNNTFTTIESFGMSRITIFQPLFCIATIFFLIHLTISIFIIDFSNSKINEIEKESRNISLYDIFKTHKVIKVSKDIMIYIMDDCNLIPGNKLQNNISCNNIFLIFNGEKNVKSRVFAKIAKIFIKDNAIILELFDGIMIKINNKHNTEIKFAKNIYKLPFFSITDLIKNQNTSLFKKQPQKLIDMIASIKGLYHKDKSEYNILSKKHKSDIARSAIELINRIIWPFYNLIIIQVTAISFIFIKNNKRRMSITYFMPIITPIFFIISYFMFHSYIKEIQRPLQIGCITHIAIFSIVWILYYILEKNSTKT